jgi:amino acid transporter
MEATKKFGTLPVFLTAISTILGAVMFLRFGYAVGNVGFVGTLLIVLAGHAVTIPTAMAIAEIATNQKVEGGGEYFIISRSFGLVIGSSIGIALYFSQAISVAFYIIAFAEAFTPLLDWIKENYQLHPSIVWFLDRKQTVSIPALFVLTTIVLAKGADLGVKALYFVAITLGLSLVAFFAGSTDYVENTGFHPNITIADAIPLIDSSQISPFEIIKTDSITPTTPNFSENNNTITNNNSDEKAPLIPASFFVVFAIIFPAFTGMTAGVGLSGDLKDPSRSIPLGTLMGTLSGMVIYVFIAFKLASSASPTDLANTSRLVMSDIAWQGWLIIPIGLAAATISSALGSIMVAPRTLQAIARDKLLPSKISNFWLAKGKGKDDEPFNATLVTIGIALVFIMMGGLDFVAGIISMFFMVTYGSLCLISFLQHFSADPSYRPTFVSRWYISLFGAIACFGLMFLMSPFYAFIAIAFMTVIYIIMSTYNSEKNNVALIFQGVIFQISRKLQVFLQKAEKEQTSSWRPSVVCVSGDSFNRISAFNLLRWISHKYGFGTYIHKITGYLSKSTNNEAKICKERLIKMAEKSNSNVYVDTLISPSYTSAIAQIIQLPGMSGTDNNLLMFEYAKTHPDNLDDIVDNFKMIKSVDFDVIILGSSEKGFGFHSEIHIWITPNDYHNANLMILLAYIILGHKDWSKGQIKIFALFPEESIKEEKARLSKLVQTGKLPISKNNIKVIANKTDKSLQQFVTEKSYNADMTILGFRDEVIKHNGKKNFEGYENVGNILFVNAARQKEIK